MNKTTSLLILTFVFTFTFCSVEKEYNEYKIYDLSKPFSDTLIFKKDGLVNNIEVLIVGKVKGESVIEFYNGAGRYNIIKLKGNVNEIYETEWYDSKCNFRYKPITNVRGDSLILKYRIY